MSEQTTRLRHLLADSLGVPPASVPSTDVLAVLGPDSVACLDFLVRVEEAFGIEIDDDDLSMALVDDLPALARYVRSRAAS
ncbi:MAG: acyl carrier protein [Saccharothrix sp.]|nr:acyl carrier protein [Saccharothrix sp.]